MGVIQVNPEAKPFSFVWVKAGIYPMSVEFAGTGNYDDGTLYLMFDLKHSTPFAQLQGLDGQPLTQEPSTVRYFTSVDEKQTRLRTFWDAAKMGAWRNFQPEELNGKTVKAQLGVDEDKYGAPRNNITAVFAS